MQKSIRRRYHLSATMPEARFSNPSSTGRRLFEGSTSAFRAA
jgi:hypothetical protein